MIDPGMMAMPVAVETTAEVAVVAEVAGEPVGNEHLAVVAEPFKRGLNLYGSTTSHVWLVVPTQNSKPEIGVRSSFATTLPNMLCSMACPS